MSGQQHHEGAHSDDAGYFNDQGYFRQTCIDLTDSDRGIIRANLFSPAAKDRMVRSWHTFSTACADESFIDWNFTERTTRIDRMLGGTMTAFGGAHNPSVASYGGLLPQDAGWNASQFTLNNAIKGMGLAPSRHAIDEMIDGLHERWNHHERQRLLHLRDLYSDRSLWDMSRQISLELYARPHNLTHSFLNWMENPLANISFMALEFRRESLPPQLPTYELRTLVHMLHPCDPAFSENTYECKLVRFANLVHDFFHHREGQPISGPAAMHIGVVHYICEEFDNYWGPAGRGRRVA